MFYTTIITALIILIILGLTLIPIRAIVTTIVVIVITTRITVKRETP